MHRDKKTKNILHFITLTSSFLLLLVLFTHASPAFAYIECETGQYTACNTNGGNTGHYMSVTNNNGNYSCQDLGQYKCNSQPYSGCQPSGLDKCVAYLPGSTPPSANIMYTSTVGDGSNCGKQAAAQGIISTAKLFCVCGMDGAPACPAPSSPPPPPNPAPTGYLDHAYCSDSGVSGWTCDPSDYSKSVRVDFYLDGSTYIGSTNTGNSRPDVSAAGFCNGNANTGYSWSLSQSKVNVFDGKQHTLTAYGINLTNPNANTALTNSPMTFSCPNNSPVNINLVLGLPGIGYNGNAPVHTQRTVTVELYDPSVANPGQPGSNPLSSKNVTLQYQTTGNNAGYFAASVNVPLPAQQTANNQYQILVKVPQYLYKLETIGSTNSNNPTIFTLTPGTTVSLPILYMDPGDLVTANGGANLLNLDDYTQLKSCYQNASSCPTTADGVPVADLNDNGSVDIVDFNILLRSLSNLINNFSSHCNGLECQGD